MHLMSDHIAGSPAAPKIRPTDGAMGTAAPVAWLRVSERGGHFALFKVGGARLLPGSHTGPESSGESGDGQLV
ncbi:hypothetical protein GCM10011576_33590 [Micromonospora parathelypteridis]|nr:hypothetical protein GCM10011576_33590 [Micromonospora parathelypteridis]